MKTESTSIWIVDGDGQKVVNIDDHSCRQDTECKQPIGGIESSCYPQRHKEMEAQVKDWAHDEQQDLRKTAINS